MIAKLIGSKALPWVAGGLVTFVAGLLLAVYMLFRQNAALNTEVGALSSEKAQLSESVRQHALDYEQLQTRLQRTEELVAEVQQQKQSAERDARERINKLRESLAADECAGTDHPAAVADSLRKGTIDSIQD